MTDHVTLTTMTITVDRILTETTEITDHVGMVAVTVQHTVRIGYTATTRLLEEHVMAMVTVTTNVRGRVTTHTDDTEIRCHAGFGTVTVLATMLSQKITI